MRKLLTLCFSFVLLWPTLCFGQISRVSAKSDSSNYQIGDLISIKLMAEKEAGTTIDWPESLPGVLHLELLEAKPPVNRVIADKVLEEKVFNYISFTPGLIHIPSFLVHHQAANGKKESSSTQGFKINVQFAEVDTATTSLKPIVEPIHLPLTWRDVWPYVLGAVLLLVVILAFLYWWKKRSNPDEEAEVYKPPVIPDKHAIEQLDLLEKEELWQAGNVKQYYTRLSEIIREYIENRFHQPALEQTTEEILLAFNEETYQGTAKSHLKHLLVLADFVKFAKIEPGEGEHMTSMTNARMFIKETKQVLSQVENKEVTDE